ncbi:hypothetical protein [Flavobacterium sp.]|uniref:hypothetical protein n=1 Tax=Flavobacterium sp. TaxID=239 RepID=UPI001213A84F|nr:hypothetical protein [Flavobacterium sp.]RZJ72996.1 MAG: hypothetical protein EOO49_05035 [Flavobacterium sp.]
MQTTSITKPHYQNYLKSTTKLSTAIAVGSFVIGSILFVLEKFRPFGHAITRDLPVYGLIFVVIAFLVNSAILLNLVILYASEPEEREKLAIRMLIVLANIPIAMIYFESIDF